MRGRRVIGISDLWSGKKKPWWNWYLTPVVNFVEVRRAQLAKSTLTSTLLPLGSFQIFKVCSDAKECRKQREDTSPIESLVKVQSWFLSLHWKTCLRQNCSLAKRLYWRTCPWAEHSDDDDDDDDLSESLFRETDKCVYQCQSTSLLRASGSTQGG